MKNLRKLNAQLDELEDIISKEQEKIDEDFKEFVEGELGESVDSVIVNETYFTIYDEHQDTILRVSYQSEELLVEKCVDIAYVELKSIIEKYLEMLGE